MLNGCARSALNFIFGPRFPSALESSAGFRSNTDPLSISRIERFKKARRTLRLSQERAAKILSVGQRQISNYENGNPPPDEEQVQMLERRVVEQRMAVQALSVGPTASMNLEDVDAVPTLLSDEAYAVHVNNFVQKWEIWNASFGGRDECGFFFFGPEHLPVFGDDRFRSLWSANLKRRVDYHLFWLLDACSKEELQQAYLTLLRIEVAAGEPMEYFSHLHVRGIMMTRKTEGNDPIRTLYNKFRDRPTESSVLVVEPLVEPEDIEAHRQEWIKAIRLGALSSVMVGRIYIDFEGDGILPADAAPPESFSVRRAENVSLKPSGPRATGWLFLDQNETRKLVELVDTIIGRSRPSKQLEGA